MRVWGIAFGVVLFVAAAADAQERCQRRYYGEDHDSQDWAYLTIDASSMGQPWKKGIPIQNQPTLVCGHNGESVPRDHKRLYCGDSLPHEWQRVWACGSGDGGGDGGGSDDGGSDDNGGQGVRLSMEGDSEWVMEGGGPKDVTVNAELTGGPRDARTRVAVTLDPHEASPNDFETDGESFQILIPANRRSASHTFMFKPVDDDREERDENLIFTGDTGAANLPVDPTTLMIKDNDDPGGPAFAESRFVFDLPEERDGRADPYRLGVVTARDPAAHPLTYALAEGDGSRFEVGASSGAITYVGPGEDYENGTRQYELRLTARNGDRRTARARVTVRVTDVPEAPQAEDDQVETLEDESVAVDVLANDSDAEGDLLRIVSVSAPAHGTATVESGRVRYAPASNHHGLDAFDYTVSDPEGLTGSATVDVTVLAVNDAPAAVESIPEQALEEGGEPLTLDLAPYFDDVDRDALTYKAESSNPSATVVTLSGSTLTLSAVVRGAATVTVTATDPGGLTATQVFGVAVGDHLVREVLTDTLAALGRGHLSSVRQTVGRRLETHGAQTPRLALAGQHFSPLMWNRLGTGGLARTHEWYYRAAMLQQRRAATELTGTSADPRFRESNGFLGVGGFGGGWDQALLGTDMLLTFGGGDEGAARSGSGRPRWTLWGQGDLQTFRGTPEPVKGYEGDLRTGYVGVDVQVTGGWLLGVAMARSGGTGTWRSGASSGDLSTTLTRVHPYVRWANDDTAVWGVLGVGQGTANHVRTVTGRGETSPLSLRLGLLEGRRRLATVGGGFEIGARGEASWAQLATGGGDETIDDMQAGVRRTRGGIEVARALSAPGGLTLTPFGEISTRHDGGAGPTGFGMEVAGGLRLRGGRVQLEAQGRRLVLHSATAYEEQGVSLAATLGSSPYEPGLTLSLRPTWGATGMGAESLWQDQIRTYMPGSAHDRTGMDARLGYGLRLGRDGLLTPFTSFGQRQHGGRRLQVGTRVGAPGQGPGSLQGPFQLEISGERYDRPGGNPDHRFSMFGVVNLGGRSPARGTATGIDPRLHEPASDPVGLAALQHAELPVSATDVAPIEAEAPALVSAVQTRTARNTQSRPRSNRAPAFSAPSYAFETPSRGGSRRKLEPLGVVVARDPNGGPVTARDTGRLTETATVVVTVASTPGVPGPATSGAAGATRSSAPARGDAASRSAAARAAAAAPHAVGAGATAGEPRTPAALPASVARSIAAARAAAAARSVSAGRPAAAAPRGARAPAAGAGRRTALADAARTYAGVPVLIDVLENDAGHEGMRIVDVSTPAHGTATITNGVVRYAPAPGHRGRDTFTYTVVGEDGRTARASVTVTVVG